MSKKSMNMILANWVHSMAASRVVRLVRALSLHSMTIAIITCP